MNRDLLGYIIPILGSALSLISAIYSLFYAQKISKNISQVASSAKKVKEKENYSELNQKSTKQILQDGQGRLDEPDLQEKEMEMEQLLIELKEMYKIIDHLEGLTEQESKANEWKMCNQLITDLLKASEISRRKQISLCPKSHTHIINDDCERHRAAP